MSKMKSLFRKRRTIIPDHHQSPPNISQNPPANVSPSSTNSSSPNSTELSSSAVSAGVGTGGSGGGDFNRFEEEYQVQLALALSASDPDGVEDLDLVQMKAAKRMSLVSSATAEAGIVSGGGDNGDDRKMEFLSLRYWSYNVINYDEKLADGFYDVYGVVSSPNSSQEKMPSLVDLQGITVSDNIGYEVVLVNHHIDFALQELETRVASIALECRTAEHGPISSGLVQKIADIVVERMGGPVGDTELMLRRWTSKGFELRTSLNTIILPLGLLDVGLSRHRALLFKVLADSVNLPCKLVKGSNYTGTDEGAVNVIKVGNESEYIVDLMGAPGALIPAEVPSIHVQNSVISSNNDEPTDQSAKDFTDDQSAKDLCVAFDNINSQFEIKNQTVINPENKIIILPTHSSDVISPAQQMKVNDVSKYVVTAAKDPEFAQKLHAVLLESGASPPFDLFSDLNLHQDPIEKYDKCSSKEAESSMCANQRKIFGMQSLNVGTMSDSCCSTDSLLDGVAAWEIPWEDLHFGERIGLGSYGEVYRADWNGTEVAVKRLLDQSLCGDALDQFRCEVKIMLRSRHPNVVLFMGAVTRPPNLSILTEFLPRGSLYRLLHRPNAKIDERRRLRMALDVAKGMNYLHTSHPTIVHRDLKTPNLLVDKNWVVKVCDFGLSRLKQNTFLSSKSTAGTPEWMAPEVLQNEPSDEKCDVYSFGVILWELATMRMPWSGMNPMQVVGAVGFQNRRLDIPEEIDPVVAKIIMDCWESEPSRRPSFSQLMSPLKKLQRLVVTTE